MSLLHLSNEAPAAELAEFEVETAQIKIEHAGAPKTQAECENMKAEIAFHERET